MAALNGRPIADVGTLEAEWEAGGYLIGLRSVSLLDLMDGATRLVFAAPHPDDETLGCGGLISMALSAGVEVEVVSITDGEACYPGDGEWSEARLREVRSQEQDLALGSLGHPRGCAARFGIPDGAIAAHEAAVAKRLAGFVRPGDILLAPWRRDGHPDHEAVARAAAAAAAASGARLVEFPIWAWHWANSDGSDFGDASFHRLELSANARYAKRAALSCFISQIRPGADTSPILPPHVLKRFDRPFEVYIHG